MPCLSALERNTFQEKASDRGIATSFAQTQALAYNECWKTIILGARCGDDWQDLKSSFRSSSAQPLLHYHCFTPCYHTPPRLDNRSWCTYGYYQWIDIHCFTSSIPVVPKRHFCVHLIDWRVQRMYEEVLNLENCATAIQFKKPQFPTLCKWIVKL